MTEAEALARLERMTAASEEPVLSSEELTDLLNLSKTVDSWGVAPGEDGWSPSWDLNRGAAEGWRWKAAKVASRFQFTTDGASYHREQVMQHCERMSLTYRRKILSNVNLPGPLATGV